MGFFLCEVGPECWQQPYQSGICGKWGELARGDKAEGHLYKAKGINISLGQGEDVLLCQVVVITDCAMHDHIFDEKWGQ